MCGLWQPIERDSEDVRKPEMLLFRPIRERPAQQKIVKSSWRRTDCWRLPFLCVPIWIGKPTASNQAVIPDQ